MTFKVSRVKQVIVDQIEPADPRPGERYCDFGTQRAQPDNTNSNPGELAANLAGTSDRLIRGTNRSVDNQFINTSKFSKQRRVAP